MQIFAWSLQNEIEIKENINDPLFLRSVWSTIIIYFGACVINTLLFLNLFLLTQVKLIKLWIDQFILYIYHYIKWMNLITCSLILLKTILISLNKSSPSETFVQNIYSWLHPVSSNIWESIMKSLKLSR